MNDEAALPGRPASNSSPSPSTIAAALSSAAGGERRCQWPGCEKLLRPTQEKWCGDPHKMRAYRRRRNELEARALVWRAEQFLPLIRAHDVHPLDALDAAVRPGLTLVEASRLAVERTAA